MRVFHIPNVSFLLRAAMVLSVLSAPVRSEAIAPARVLAALETELGRLDKIANDDPGPDHPPTARNVAYFLLIGLAAQGKPMTDSPDETLRQMGIPAKGNRRARLIQIGSDARVLISESAIQDKTGYWTSKTAELFRLVGDKWVKRGSGAMATD